jgi:hypothetical protein
VNFHSHSCSTGKRMYSRDFVSVDASEHVTVLLVTLPSLCSPDSLSSGFHHFLSQTHLRYRTVRSLEKYSELSCSVLAITLSAGLDMEHSFINDPMLTDQEPTTNQDACWAALVSFHVYYPNFTAPPSSCAVRSGRTKYCLPAPWI